MQRKFHCFDDFMRAVNIWLARHHGLHSDDLPDFLYADAWEDGKSPEATAKRAMRAAQAECGL